MSDAKDEKEVVLPAINSLPNDLKNKHESAYKSSIRSSMQTLETIERKKAELGVSPLAALLNFAQYILVVHMDLQSTTRRYLTSENEWDVLLNARVFSLVLYEFLYNSPKMWQDFKKSLSILHHEEDVLKMEQLYNELRDMRKENKEFLSVVRHNTIAHMNENVEHQLRIITNIDVKRCMALNLKSVNVLTAITNLVTSIINTANSSK